MFIRDRNNIVFVFFFASRRRHTRSSTVSLRDLVRSRGLGDVYKRQVLFGARDVWFVVGVPVFLYASGWTFTMVGGFLAALSLIHI